MWRRGKNRTQFKFRLSVKSIDHSLLAEEIVLLWTRSNQNIKTAEWISYCETSEHDILLLQHLAFLAVYTPCSNQFPLKTEYFTRTIRLSILFFSINHARFCAKLHFSRFAMAASLACQQLRRASCWGRGFRLLAPSFTKMALVWWTVKTPNCFLHVRKSLKLQNRLFVIYHL